VLLAGARAAGALRHRFSPGSIPPHAVAAARDTPMNLACTLVEIAKAHPRSPALTWSGGTIDYAGFEGSVQQIAGALRQRHRLQPGRRIALWMENCAEFFPVMFGAWRAGLAAVPVNSKLHPREFAWIAADAGAGLIVATPALADSLSQLPSGELASLPPVIVTGTSDYRALAAGDAVLEAPADPGDEAWLFYTSGTTGRPKGAVLTHRNLLFACHAYYADIDFIDHRDCILHAAALSHGAGLYGIAHIARGSEQIIHAGFDPDAILATFAARHNVSMFAAPTMVSRLVNHPRAGGDLAGLKCIAYGGAPMYVADLKRAIALFGPRLYQLYGQGESPMTITGLDKAMHADSAHPRYEQRLASAGIARTGVAWKIVGEDGRMVPNGQVGEIVTRSDCVMKGYWRNAEANARSLREGWLWTGDLGSRDDEGFLTIKDRSKDMIISGGSNIYPREIEDVLLTHAGVLECAVVSRPHPDWGEEVIAFGVARPDAAANAPVDAAALDRLCLGNIARFKRPRGYRFVAALPKNNYGKILKTQLRATLAEESSGGGEGMVGA
jgi:acyl-CoA synthetase (AMP-forming)/AMP-acid ligase II